MNISPLDIRKHEFRKTFRGYDVDEVVSFLDMVSMEFESMVRENSLLRERVANLEESIKKYRDIEGTLQETLLSAQKAREDTIKTAKKQAEVIIREAEVKAASIVEDGRRELTGLRNRFTSLKVHKDAYLSKLKAIVATQEELLDSYDFAEEAHFAGEEPEKEVSPPSAPREDTGEQKGGISFDFDSLDEDEEDTSAESG